MKILILVLSCREPPYGKLYEAQQRTWDSLHVEGVVTRYYFPLSMDTMLLSLKVALDTAWDEPWDSIFRTNSSSYVNKAMLQKFASALPKIGCYCGVDGGGFASGSGMLLSRDVVDVLRQRITEKVYDHVEDEEIGLMLKEHGIDVTPGAKRYDFYFEDFQKRFYGRYLSDFRNHYHVRCKSDTEDRMKDVEAMEIVHMGVTA